MNCGLYALALTAVLTASQWRTISSAEAATTMAAAPFAGRCDPTRCLIHYSQAWAKTIGLDVPTSSMLQGAQLMGKNDTYGIMCSLYASHVACLKACDANRDRAPVGVLMPKFSEICSDNQPDFGDAAPCLSANASFITKSCEKANNIALAAAIRLTEQQQKMDGSIERNINNYCDAINNQIYCELPAVHQFCQFEAYDLLRKLIGAAFVSLRHTFGREPLKHYFPKCDELLRTTDDGIPGIVNPSNTTTVATTTLVTTMAAEAAAANHVTTDQSINSTIISIETNNKTTMTARTASGSVPSIKATTAAVIQKDAADPYKGDATPPTTTPSSAINLSTGRSTLVMVITSFFFIFHLL